MKKIKKYLKLMSLLLLIVATLIGLAIKIDLIKKKKEVKTNPIIQNIPEKKEKINEDKQPIKVYVDIKGAVKKPGVYEIEDNKKVIDVINLADGFTDNADTSMINLAKKVTNEMVIIIYTKEEVKEATKPNQIIKYVDKECICPKIKNDACINTMNEKNTDKNDSTSKEEQTTNTTSNKVNINTATIEELQTLNGVGESKAQAIITYREEKGEYKSIEEIKNVPGIGEALYEKIKDSITI